MKTAAARRLFNDDAGRVLEYQRRVTDAESQPPQFTEFSYDQHGEMTSVGRSSLGHVAITQEPHFVTVTQENTAVKYQYGANKRLSRIECAVWFVH